MVSRIPGHQAFKNAVMARPVRNREREIALALFVDASGVAMLSS